MREAALWPFPASRTRSDFRLPATSILSSSILRFNQASQLPTFTANLHPLSLSLSFVSALKARPVDFPGLFKESFSTRDNTEGGRGPSRDGRTMREESNRCQHFPLPRTTRATRFYPLEMALVKSVPPPPPPLLLFSTFPRFDSVRSRKDLSSKSNSEVRKIHLLII